jgi:hypothetical protein
MALRGTTLAVFIAFLLANSIPAKAQYNAWEKKSVITLQDISEVPGMVLEPGTYVLKAEDNLNNPRTIVELLNKDESQILTRFVGVPDNRMRQDPDVVLTFFPGITDGPRPIQSWFYPGEMNGLELVYPKARAKEIAKHTEDHVMASDSKEAAIVAVTSTGTEVPVYDAIGRAKTQSSEDTRDKPQTTAVSATPKKSKAANPKRQ